MYSVTLYLCDRAYGGPEEGGWYFDCGTPVMHTENRIVSTEEEALELCSKLNSMLLDNLNEDRPDINSVNSEGRYRFMVGEKDEFPSHYPKERPYYN